MTDTHRGFSKPSTRTVSTEALERLEREVRELRDQGTRFRYRGVTIELYPAGSRRWVGGYWHNAPTFGCPDYYDGAPDATGTLCRPTTDIDELLDAIDRVAQE